MKVGTDGVLLGAWAPLRPRDRRLLDVGCGTGVIALILAQRAPEASITALDIDPECVARTRENGDRSPWGGRIESCHAAVQEFEAEPFDLIVTNPPYFVDSLLSPNAARTMARHTASLPFEELVEASVRLLKPEGRLALILPTDEAARFLRIASSHLWLECRCAVRSTPRRPVKRVMMLLSRCQPLRPVEEQELIIQTAPECYTPEYRALTRDFYLKF